MSAAGAAPPAGMFTQYTIDGVVTTSIDSSSFTAGSVPSISAQYCIGSILGTFCGASSTVTPAGGSAPTTMWVEYPTTCPVPATTANAPAVSISGGGGGTADVVVTATEDLLAIPATVTYAYTPTWINDFASLTAPDPHTLVCPL